MFFKGLLFTTVTSNVGNFKAELPIVDLKEGGTNSWPGEAFSRAEELMGFSRLPLGTNSFFVTPILSILE